MRVVITLVDILKYIGDGRRPLREGEALMLAGHIVKCGTNKEQYIHAYVIQSSAIQKDPHVVTIHLNDDPLNWVCTCTCKAGLGSKCKHIVGVLLYINRNDIEEITCTDLVQQWGKDSAKGRQAEYKQPIRIREYCHVTTTNKAKFQVPKDIQQKNLSAFLKCKPNSALAKFSKGRTVTKSSPICDKDDDVSVMPTTSSPHPLTVSTIGYNKPNNKENEATSFPLAESTKYAPAENIFRLVAKQNEIAVSLEKYMPPVGTEIYRKNVLINETDCIQIYNKTKGQNNSLWKEYRKFRITGSTCYALYTYSKNKDPDWKKKVQHFMNPIFFGNENNRRNQLVDAMSIMLRRKY